MSWMCKAGRKARGWHLFLFWSCLLGSSVSAFQTAKGPLLKRGALFPLWACECDPEKPHEDNIDNGDPSRRGFLSIGSAVTAALSMMSSVENADALPPSTPSNIGSTYNPDIPYSSVRRYKTITLPNNGLRVLLVSDKQAFRAQCALTVQAGQFNDPDDLPGLAHLMEHMILSYNSKSTFRANRDFEDWLSDCEGASNAFTANQKSCFHFSVPKASLPLALERFAGLFLTENVESVCRDKAILEREVRRVDSELDFSSVYVQEEYLAKAFVNLEHPYARFSKGSLESLEETPKKYGIDVGECLIRFFRQYYSPRKAVLVILGPQDVFALERWAAPFAFALSKDKTLTGSRGYFPGQFLEGNRYKQVILFRNSNESSSDSEKLTFEWVTDLDYRDMVNGGKKGVTAPQIAFVLNQIIARRGPGSLYMYLLRRRWILNGAMSVPRITVPVDASGFQILKLEINLTLEGFLNRSIIVAAVFDSIETLRIGDSFVIPRELMAQYATIAKLFGYYQSPRPPDAIELSFDSLVYGLDAVGSGKWYRFPSVEDKGGLGLNVMRRAVSLTLNHMSKPDNTVIVATAGSKAITLSQQGFNDPILPQSSPRWTTEPISGACFYFEDLLQVKSRVEQLVLTRTVNREELLPPVYNALVPTMLRPARAASGIISGSVNGVEDSVLLWNGVESTSLGGDRWSLLSLPPGQQGLPLPRSPPEPSCRCSFVLQLLSPRPARANVRQAARAELWKLAFETSAVELAELGAPGGLAYDLSFNRFGLRLSFLGISQTLPSYARRMTKRLVQHNAQLLNGPVMLPTSVTGRAVAAVTTAPSLSPGRRTRIRSNLRSSTAHEVASEGIAFLRSCTGAVAFAQGDLLQREQLLLLKELKEILIDSVGSASRTYTATPSLDDLRYKPVWQPRNGSACSISGVALISDACGRIMR